MNKDCNLEKLKLLDDIKFIRLKFLFLFNYHYIIIVIKMFKT